MTKNKRDGYFKVAVQTLGMDLFMVVAIGKLRIHYGQDHYGQGTSPDQLSCPPEWANSSQGFSSQDQGMAN